MALKIAIMASGSGTNADRIISLSQEGKLQVQVVLVISNCPDAPVLEKAKVLNIPVFGLDHREYGDRSRFDQKLIEKLLASECELVVLAGYMRLLTAEFLRSFPDRIINIHPALLPSFPGIHGARDAVEYGVKISGATVHYVEEEMDRGPVIIQAAIPVMAGESAAELQNRIHSMEYKIYPQAIQWIAQGRVFKKGRQVYLKGQNQKNKGQTGNYLVWPPLEEDF